MWVFFAWVDAADVTFDPGVHARYDMRVISLEISKSAGEYAILEIETENPGVGLLASGRLQHALLSTSETGDPADAVLRFRGLVVALPSDLGDGKGGSLKFEFLGQGNAAADLLRAYGRSLLVAPYADNLFMSSAAFVPPTDGTPDDWDPAEALEARSAVYDVDELTHEITLTDYLVGDRVIDIGPNFVRDSLDPSIGEPPIPRASLKVIVEWDQKADGQVDIGARIGGVSTVNKPESFSALTEGGDFGSGSGWSTVKDSVVTSQHSTPATFMTGLKSDWTYFKHISDDVDLGPLYRTTYEYKPLIYYRVDVEQLVVGYEYSQSRREKATITMGASIQPVLGATSRDEIISEITLASITEDLATLPWKPGKAYVYGDRVQYNGKTYECRLDHTSALWFSLVPNDDLLVTVPTLTTGLVVDVIVQWVRVHNASALQDHSRTSFFDTDRGREALAHAVLRVRAFLRHRMRCFSVTFRGTWELLADVTCKDSVRIEHDFFPGGSAVGKVTSFRKVWARGGTRYVEVTLGISAGTGEDAATPGVADNYTSAWAVGYAAPAGTAFERVDDEIVWSVAGAAIHVPVDVRYLHDPGYVVQSVVWKNALEDQLRAANHYQATGRSARLGASSIPTSCTVRLRSLGSFDTIERLMTVTCSDVVGPKGIDLEAST